MFSGILRHSLDDQHTPLSRFTVGKLGWHFNQVVGNTWNLDSLQLRLKARHTQGTRLKHKLMRMLNYMHVDGLVLIQRITAARLLTRCNTVNL